MKNVVILTLMLLVSISAYAKGTRVRGYTKRNGTYVQSHNRTSPDRSKSNNWSTKGNVNPDTGKAGTKDETK